MPRASKEYQEKMYELTSHLLPAIIATYPEMDETEAVDAAVNYARSLLVELDYTDG